MYSCIFKSEIGSFIKNIRKKKISQQASPRGHNKEEGRHDGRDSSLHSL